MQVIASFFIAAWSSFLIALFTYLFVDGVVEPGSPIATRLDNNILRWFQSAEAEFATTHFHVWLQQTWRFSKPSVTKKKMQDVCLMFADLQLVTGASILLTGYSKHCEITQYHFYVVSSLAAASFMAFQTLLLAVHERLQSNLSKGWRAIWVSAIFGCVLLINFVIYNDQFLIPHQWGRTMHCLWSGLPGAFTPRLIPYVAFGTFVHVWTFYTILRYLYPGLKDTRPLVGISWVCHWVTQVPTRLYLAVLDKEEIAGSCHLSRMGQWLTWSLFIVSFTLRELSSSLYVVLIRSFYVLYQATASVKWARDLASDNGREDGEDEWGFGQILPVLLLALLLLQLVEAIRG